MAEQSKKIKQTLYVVAKDDEESQSVVGVFSSWKKVQDFIDHADDVCFHEKDAFSPKYSVATGEILLSKGEGFRRTFFDGQNYNLYDPSLHIPDGVKWRRI